MPFPTRHRRTARATGLLLLSLAAPLRARTPPSPAPLTLAQAVARALAGSPQARAGRAQLAQAEARAAQARAGRRLQVTLDTVVSGSDGAVIQAPPAHETFGTVQNTLTVPLPLGGRPRLAQAQAQAQLEAARAQYAGAALLISSQVTLAYYDLLRRQALRLVAADALAQAQRQLADADRRRRAGDVPALDVLRAQVPVASAQAQEYGAETSETVARPALAGLIGLSPDAPVAVADVSDAPPPAALAPAEAQARALAASPDVRAADAAVRAAQSALDAARLYRQPSVSLQAIDIRSNDQTSFRRVDTIQASVSVPLGDGGLGREQVREAEAALAQARAVAETARLSARAAALAASLSANGSRRQLQAARQAEDFARTSYDKTVEGYRAGLFPLSDVLSAQSALTQARIARAQAVYDAAAAQATLQSALSGGPSLAAPGPTPPPPPAAPATAPAGAGVPTRTPAGNPTTPAPGATGTGPTNTGTTP